MKRALFTENDFISTAREIAAAGGPQAVTVTSVSERLKAPIGSFYHRFESRQALLAKLWLSSVSSFQGGYFVALENNDGLSAALHVVDWSRLHFEDAKVLLLYNLKSFEEGSWPQNLKRAAKKQWNEVEEALSRFASYTLGSTSKRALTIVRFAVAGAPVAAVRAHLEMDERPPRIVDALVQCTFQASLKTWQR